MHFLIESIHFGLSLLGHYYETTDLYKNGPLNVSGVKTNKQFNIIFNIWKIAE